MLRSSLAKLDHYRCGIHTVPLCLFLMLEIKCYGGMYSLSPFFVCGVVLFGPVVIVLFMLRVVAKQ